MSRIGQTVWLTAFLMIISAGVSPAEVVPVISYTYYDVTVDERFRLDKEIFKNTPITHEGRKFAGNTRWSVKYTSKYYQPTIGICMISELKVECDCLITLPRLVGADPETEYEFSLYLTRLEGHELLHCKIAAEHADQLRYRGLNIGRQKCGDIEGKIKDIYQEVMEQAAQAQKRYDLNTVHGKLEGIDIGRTASDLKKMKERSPGDLGHSTSGEQGLRSLDRGHGFVQGEDGVWRNY